MFIIMQRILDGELNLPRVVANACLGYATSSTGAPVACTLAPEAGQADKMCGYCQVGLHASRRVRAQPGGQAVPVRRLAAPHSLVVYSYRCLIML